MTRETRNDERLRCLTVAYALLLVPQLTVCLGCTVNGGAPKARRAVGAPCTSQQADAEPRLHCYVLHTQLDDMHHLVAAVLVNRGADRAQVYLPAFVGPVFHAPGPGLAEPLEITELSHAVQKTVILEPSAGYVREFIVQLQPPKVSRFNVSCYYLLYEKGREGERQHFLRQIESPRAIFSVP